jgi:DNA-directed RNA polymerase III subunit RPC1
VKTGRKIRADDMVVREGSNPPAPASRRHFDAKATTNICGAIPNTNNPPPMPAMAPRRNHHERAEDDAKIINSKESFVKANAPRRIKKVTFSTMSGSEIAKAGVFHVTERTLYKPAERTPLEGGILDPRLGTTSKLECQTCKGKIMDCSGHFGYLKLELPVFHVGYFKAIVHCLQCVCKECSCLLMKEEEQDEMLTRLRSREKKIGGVDHAYRRVMFKKLLEKCKRTKVCYKCEAVNGPVKRAGQNLKIIHEKYTNNKAEQEKREKAFEEAMKHNDQLRQHLSRAQDDLNPIRVLQIFKRIADKDLRLLDLAQRPENMVITHLSVPPCCIRPSVELDGQAGSTEDDISMKLVQIIEINNVLRQGLERGLAVTNMMENWEFLQIQFAMYINSELPGISSQYQSPGKPLRGFVQRLKGKQGRFRGNLSGKRVDFTARTVISPDPNLRIDEVGMPQHIAMQLTYPETVNNNNIAELRQLVINGEGKWPGANFVKYQRGASQYLKYGDRNQVARKLRPGDVVERHVRDGDIVLFNRQPSLHKMSIMAHRAKVMPWRTLRFNECVCAPYNADFDGDEMNIHLPQTEEARAEAISLMGVTQNLCTPKNGEILIAATQDFLTASFLLTSKEVFFDRSQFGQLAAYMSDALESIDLPSPAIVKPIELWTGKQIFSVLIRPRMRDQIFVNLEVAEKAYTKMNQQMCSNDGYVCIQNSEIISGQLGKATLGGGNKTGLFYVLNSDYGADVAANAMNRLAKLAARWIGIRGFSIGIDDVKPSPELEREKQSRVDSGYAKCDERIASYEKGTLDLQPGCNAEQTLEAEVLGVLSAVREAAGNACLDALPKLNSPLVMALCGSKGSTINISQMMACVGQQAVGGSRPPDGFSDRSLPHFKRGEKTPAAKGFVANSFYSGLLPTEFFFHTMAGREGLVDTAVKTAETGYMSRRLMKALEDLSLGYDGTVRNSSGDIVQLEYGDDGMEPTLMEGSEGEPVDLKRLMLRAKGLIPQRRHPNEENLTTTTSKNGRKSGKSGTNASSSTVKLEGKDKLILTKEDANAILEKRGFGEKDLPEDDEDERLRAGLQYGKDNISHRFKQSVRDYITSQEVLSQKLSTRRVDAFLKACVQKYKSKRIEPGTAVGAVGAQSIGEPGTQMTLKTFHFAGVASMNITLGVPRIKEIINATKNISTPIITAKLISDKDVKAARLVKGRMEKTTLGEICESISVVLRPSGAYLEFVLDEKAIAALQLDVTAESAREAILAAPKLKLKDHNVVLAGSRAIHVLPPDEKASSKDPIGKKAIINVLQSLRTAVPKVIVRGLSSVTRAVINKGGMNSKEDKDSFNLIVEGTNLLDVMAIDGVVGEETTTNHIMEAERSLGIEAARSCVIKEINDTMKAHGMSIDSRHSMLLADVMTYKGEVLGITRFGMAKMKESVLMLASFEKTTDHLFEAALRGRTDEIDGVSECIIMGIPMPIGTGMFKLKQRNVDLKLTKLDRVINIDEDEDDEDDENEHLRRDRSHYGEEVEHEHVISEIEYTEIRELPKRPPILLRG